MRQKFCFHNPYGLPKHRLMSAYALYSQNYYDDALFNLKRHIKNYPKDKNLVYAHYLIAICYFEQLYDEKKDLKPLVKAREKFVHILNNYPNTDYAIDAKWKMGLIVDQMAAKEMYIGRYYIKTEKWIAAINRFRFVVEHYDTTVYIEEALHRLVEIYYKIGLVEEAQKVAAVLGYNYGSGEWYKNSYKIFNKSYKIEQLTKKEKDSFLKEKIQKIVGQVVEKEKIKALYFDKIVKLNEYNKAYYDQDNPIISDHKYDRLKIEILNLEKKYKFLKSKLSPTKNVGYKISGKFKKIKHKIPMLSLSNAFAENNIVDFLKKIKNFLKLSNDYKIEISAEPKIDGISASLHYISGQFKLGLSRGDGITGEDITLNPQNNSKYTGKIKRFKTS